MREEIRLSGFGGQGVALAGYVLGKAFALYEDLEVVMTQAYGPEARGGASNADIVISDEPIDYPFVQQSGVLVAMSQESYTRFRSTVRPDAMILIDDELVEPSPEDNLYGVPATRLAEELGRRIVANMVMLGFFTAVTGLVSREAMEKAIESSVRPKTVPLNLRAFAMGFEHSLPEPTAPEEQAV